MNPGYYRNSQGSTFWASGTAAHTETGETLVIAAAHGAKAGEALAIPLETFETTFIAVHPQKGEKVTA